MFYFRSLGFWSNVYRRSFICKILRRVMADFYVPSTKKELYKMLAPIFQGDPGRLKRMSKKQLYAILYKGRRAMQCIS